MNNNQMWMNPLTMNPVLWGSYWLQYLQATLSQQAPTQDQLVQVGQALNSGIPATPSPSLPPSSAETSPESASSSNESPESKPRKRYPCPECGATVSRKFLLQGHMRVHTKEKPFQCRHCEKSFADASNRRVHEQIHAEDKKFACADCGKRFAVNHYLTKHVQRKHKKD